jgi:hypothetical protein
VLTTSLNGAAEVPPVATQASGDGTTTISADRSQIDYTLDLAGPFSSAVTMAHIHAGPAGSNGPVIFFLCTNVGGAPASAPTPPTCPTGDGSAIGTLTAANFIPNADAGVNTFAEALSAMIAGNTYINVHTTVNPTGEIRGQLASGAQPVAATADVYNGLGNTPITVPALNGVLANDPAGATITASDAQTTSLGTVTVAADGGFTYTPLAGFTGADTFTYSVDTAGEVSTATVTVNIANKAVFVDNTAVAGGDGSFATPFDTLTAGLSAAGAGDTVFVNAGDGLPLNGNLPVTLPADRKLLGEGADFTFPVMPGVPVTIVAANPLVLPRLATDDTVIDSTVHMGNGSELAGFSLQALGILVDPVDPALNEGLPTVSAAGITDFTIRNNVIADPAGSGIATADVNGTGVITDNTITGLLGEHAGIDLFFRLASATAQLEVSRNTVTVTDGELAAAIDLVVRPDAGLTSDVKAVMDGNIVRGGRGIDPVDGALPDMGILSRGAGATVCVELTNTTSPDAGAVFAAEAVAPGTLQLAEAGNIGTVAVLGATTVPLGSCN